MSISQPLLAEFDQEMAITRRALERVPDDKFSYQPHPRSMTMGRLVSHLAEIPMWGAMTVQRTEIDIKPIGAPEFVLHMCKSQADLLATFDKNREDARAAIAAATDEQWMVPWSLKAAGNTIFTLPRIAVMRSFVFSHSIHHRGQLSVYLRLNDIPVPSIYGPSADEGNM